MPKIIKFLLPMMFMYYSCGDTSKLIKNDWLSGIKPPVILQIEELPYPEKARKQGLEGVVGLHIYITEDGEVMKSRVSTSSGIKFLDEAAEEYVKKLKYKPAERDGKPVGVWLSLDINYNLVDKEIRFDLRDYLRRLSRQLFDLESRDGEPKDQVLSDLIETYQEYVIYICENQLWNYNKEILFVLDNKTITYWQNYLEWWPLTFILYYDFIIRFPESAYLSTATEKMVILINEDVNRIIQLSKDHDYPAERISGFFNAIYSFLEENYPEHLDEPLKKNLQIYLD